MFPLRPAACAWRDGVSRRSAIWNGTILAAKRPPPASGGDDDRLASKFAHLVYALTAADQIFTFIVAAGLTIILGMGMPTPSAYILAAVLMSPLMKQVGISDLSGHMFILYFAVLSAITPPVAVAAFAAASISGDNPILIAAHAVKLALAAFLVPFVFVFGPELLWEGPVWKTALTFTTAAIGLIFVSAAIEQYSTWAHNTLTRVILGVGGLLMLTPFIMSTVVGVLLVGVATAMSRMARRQPTPPDCVNGASQPLTRRETTLAV